MSSRDHYIQKDIPVLNLIVMLFFLCKSANTDLGLAYAFQVCWNDHFSEISWSGKLCVHVSDDYPYVLYLALTIHDSDSFHNERQSLSHMWERILLPFKNWRQAEKWNVTF